MSEIHPVYRLPRISVILSIRNQTYDKHLFQKIINFGIIEYFNVHCHWQTKELDGLEYIAFKIVMANPDEIYEFLQNIKTKCSKVECWLIRARKSPEILFYRAYDQYRNVVEEDNFQDIDVMLLSTPNQNDPFPISQYG